MPEVPAGTVGPPARSGRALSSTAGVTVYANSMAYGGPVEDFSAKIRDFFAREKDYQQRVKELPQQQAKLAGLRSYWTAQPVGGLRTQALARIAQLELDLAAQSRGSGAIAGTIAKARAAIEKAVQLVRKVVPGFGIVDPATLTAVLTAAAVITTALAVMGLFVSRDLRIREQIALEQDKLEAVASGILPPDALKPKGDALDKLAGIGALLAVAAGLFFLPKLKGLLR